MKYFLLTCFVIIAYSTALNAQSDTRVKKKDFKTIKDGFRIAWKHIEKGDKYYSGGGIWYAKALDEYLMANNYNNSSAELNYKIGVACLFSDRKEEAANYFEKALGIKADVSEDALLLKGMALRYNSRFDEAIETLNIFLDAEMNKPEENIIKAKKIIDECTSARELKNDTARIEIRNIGESINSDSDDYSELLSADGMRMIFASRKPISAKAKNDYDDTKYDENIFISDYNGGTWSEAIPAGRKINSELCETPLFLSASGEILYIYAGYEGNGDLKVSELKKGEWSSPGPESFGINSSSAETSFSMAPGGNEIAFVSDRPKTGHGGRDIYFINKISNRKWSKPANAGTGINTSYNEESVWYSRTGDTLWFSSAGHNTMGGYDIFYTVRNEAGGWSTAVNAGFPLNTVYDELFYTRSTVDDSLFYFVSDRNGGFGGLDIYSGRILPPPPPPVLPVQPAPPVTDTVVVRDTVVIIKEIPKVIEPETPRETALYFEGKISDSENGNPISARLEISEFSTEAVIATATSSESDGFFRTILPGRKIYLVNINASGFLPELKKIAVPESFSGDSFSLDFTMEKVSVGKKVVLNNILFELGKSVLTKSSYVEADRLVTILNDNPLMKIEISGHTDNTGNPVVNARLSTERARAVVDYIVSKGIDKSRLTYRGYGSEQPIGDNATDEGRRMNRRVEFKILEY